MKTTTNYLKWSFWGVWLKMVSPEKQNRINKMSLENRVGKLLSEIAGFKHRALYNGEKISEMMSETGKIETMIREHEENIKNLKAEIKQRDEKKKVYPDSSYSEIIFLIIGGSVEASGGECAFDRYLHSYIDGLSVTGLTFYTKEAAEKKLAEMKQAALNTENMKTALDENVKPSEFGIFTKSILGSQVENPNKVSPYIRTEIVGGFMTPESDGDTGD